MASKFCCAAPQRSDSPELPNARSPAVAENTEISDPDPAVGSTVTSTRTEDRQELQRIFESAGQNTDDLPQLGQLSKAKDSAEVAVDQNPRPPSLVGKLRKRLSKTATKSHSPLKDDGKPKSAPKPHFLIDRNSPEVKKDIQENLLSESKPDDGGYDPNAESVDIRETLPSGPHDEPINSPIRGRKIPRRSPLQDIEWQSRAMTSYVTLML